MEDITAHGASLCHHAAKRMHRRCIMRPRLQK